METRANFVLIGAFVLSGLIGGVAFVLWFAQVQLDRAFAFYDISFDSVSGLSRASDVRFAGLPVGQVVDVRLSPTGDGTILVRIEVDAATPIRADSIATIEAQGVTGVSFVGISPGSPDSPLLESDRTDIPMISAGRSVLQTLTEDAPELITEVLEVARAVGAFLGEENQRRVGAILANAESASENFAAALDDFSAVSATIATAAAETAAFTTQLESIAQAATRTLEEADTALAAFTSFAGQAESTLAAGDTLITAATMAFGSADAFLLDDLPVLANELRSTNEALRAQIDALAGQAGDMLTEFSATGAEARNRLAEAQATIAAADTALAGVADTLAGIERVAAGVDGFLRDDAARLVEDARAALVAATGTLRETDVALDAFARLAGQAEGTLTAGDALIVSADAFLAGDLPALTGDLRETSAALRAQIDALAGQAGDMLTEFGATGAEARARLAQAEATIAAADTALAGLTGTLSTIDRTATRIDGLVRDDVTPLVQDTRSAIAAAARGIEAVTAMTQDDLPAIISDIRAATETANRVFSTVGADLQGASGRIAELADTGTATLGTVADTFERGSRTLDAIDSALATGEAALAAAERTFDGASRILDDELGAVIADLRRVMDGLDNALAQVAADLPEVTADLRRAARAAATTFDDLGGIVAAADAPVRQFASAGLPQFTRLAREARALITSLERVSRQLEREPSRFLLDRQPPEFRR
ncbi:MAG: MCE family protein [Pararhodobacter sp.]|nr:MCE family protein [Pararhodobacter sp.]